MTSPVRVWTQPGSARHTRVLGWQVSNGTPPEVVAEALLAELDRQFQGPVRRVQTTVDSTDHASLAAAALAGLRREGVARDACQGGGDEVLLARLKSDVDPRRNALPTLASSFHRMLTAAGLLVRNRSGDVLLLETSYKPEWELPGGLAEPGEDPVTTARRESMEELGLTLPVGALLCADLCPDNGARPDLLGLVFDGGVHASSLLAELRFADGEILSAHWCDRDLVRARASPILAGRLLAALDGLRSAELPGPALMLREGRRVAGYSPDREQPGRQREGPAC